MRHNFLTVLIKLARDHRPHLGFLLALALSCLLFFSCAHLGSKTQSTQQLVLPLPSNPSTFNFAINQKAYTPLIVMYKFSTFIIL